MQYREIVAVTGLGGLYQLLSTKGDGAIVRSLGEQATKFISSRQHNVTPLESIEIYTIGDNVRLHEVFEKMKESEQTRPEPKADPAAIRAYFQAVYPDMDHDRVYVSDMKKMLKWFELLKGADLLDFSNLYPAAETTEEPVAETSVAPEAPAPEAEKPVKKARAKKAAATDEAGAEKPAKKTAKKKADTTGDQA